ncbi:11426_t:CDS:1, partial [Gigaspora rosea]
FVLFAISKLLCLPRPVYHNALSQRSDYKPISTTLRPTTILDPDKLVINAVAVVSDNKDLL